MYIQARTQEEYTDDPVEPPPAVRPDHVLLIYSHIDHRETGTEDDLLSDLDTIETALGIAKALESIGHPVTPVPVRCVDDAVAAACAFDPSNTLIINMCEALPGMFDGESAVLRPLEAMGFAYLGGSPENLDVCRDKISAKQRLVSRGVSTPPYQIFETGRERITVPLPAIVKPAWEDGSVGITRESVVEDAAALRRRVAYVLEVYRQPALVEMFLDGREFNISVWDNNPPQVLPLAETNYGGWSDATRRVLNYESKWIDGAEEFTCFTVDCPARVDAKTARTIRKLALETWRAVGCRDFFRVDMREKDGKMYVIDVNPNPCIATTAGFSVAAGKAGYDYAHMVAHLVEIGWRRGMDERMLMTA